MAKATEAKWLAKGDPAPILREHRDNLSARKRLLFACACCRHTLSLLPHLPYLGLLDRVEASVDGPTRGGMTQGVGTLEVPPGDLPGAWAAEAITTLCNHRLDRAPSSVSTDRLDEVRHHAARSVRDQARGRDWSAAMKQQTMILCDLLGHLLHTSVTFNPAWLQWNDGTVRKMAEAIYRDNTFADVPILADALEEAGCGEAVILHHCRAKMRHYRGCWVVDALLGKE